MASIDDIFPAASTDTPLPLSGWRLALGGSALGLALGGFGAVPAFAADTVVTPAVSVDAAAIQPDSYQVQDSGLTKLTSKLRDTAQSIGTVSQQQMQEQNVTTVHDALRNVPGISLAAGENGNQGDNLTIRGFSARSDIYLDGMRDFGSYNRDSFDIESVEVLKGPSSALFGRGSTGGVVEQNTKTPGLTNFIKGEASLGTDDTKRIVMDMNQVLSAAHGTAMRMAIMGHDSGVTDRDRSESSRLGFAPSIVTGLGTPTRLTFQFLHQSEYDVPDYGLPWLYSAAPGSGTSLARVANVGSSNFYGPDGNQYFRANVNIATFKAEHDLNDRWTVRDQARYGHYTRSFDITEPQIDIVPTAAGASATTLLVAPGTPLSSLLVSRNQLVGQSIETFLQNQLDTVGHFTTGSVKHTVVAGLEFGRETSDPNKSATIGPYSTTSLVSPNENDAFSANTYFSSHTTTTALSQAVYAVDTIEFTPKWRLIAGARWDRFDAAFDQQVFANPVTHAGASTVALKRIDTKPSWRLGGIYKPAPNGTIYADWGTSFNPSAEQLSLSVATDNLAPETNETYELGSKWDLLHERLSVDGAIFHTQKNNMRETDPNNALQNLLIPVVIAKGVELSVTGNVTPNWNVQAGYGYTFSKVVSSPLAGDLGHRLANAPMHTASLWTTYTFPDGKLKKLQIGGGVNYVSSRFAASTPRVVGGVSFFSEAPGYYTMGAIAAYPLSDSIKLQVNAINLTDNRYDDLIHPSHVIPGAGRTFLFSTSFKL